MTKFLLIYLFSFFFFFFSENPCSGEEGYRVEMLILLKHLKRLDKDEVTASEKEEAEDLLKSRQEEDETTEGKEDVED